jgi:PIN domain nuclease of toxin-antitoxin system
VSFLLDTHLFLWWLADDPRLTAEHRRALADPEALVHVSAATIWEISIKEALGRIELEGDLTSEIEDGGFIELPIRARHALAAGRLPRHHDDPFDRMLVAQAREEELTLVSRDKALRAYQVDLL